MSRLHRFAFLIALVSTAFCASAQTGMSASYAHHAIQVSIPYHGLRTGKGHLALELLSPENQVLAHADRSLEIAEDSGKWSSELILGRDLSFDDLIWERLRCRFVFDGDHAPAFTQTRSASTVLRRPVVHLLGQTTYLAGSPAALRVIVNDGTPDMEPIGNGTVRIELLKANDGRTLLYSGRLDRRGTVDAQFRFPVGLSGAVSLYIVAETSAGAAETTETVHLEDKVSILLTTEKPIYQPSQTIHVRALALDRADHLAAASRKLTFEMEDARGNRVFRKEAETDSFGVASAEFVLADEVNLGAWHLRAVMPAQQEKATANQAELTLQVQRYVLPKFRVAINFAEKDGKQQRDFRPGDHVTGTVEAKYFFGKPVNDAEISIVATGMDVSTFKAAKSEGRTDADGKYRFDLTLPSYFAGRSGTQGAAPVLLEATVKDTAGHSETRGEPITVTDSALLIQAVPESGALIPGLDNIVYIMTSYPDGTPASATVLLRLKGSALASIETGKNGIGMVHISGTVANEQLHLEADDHHGKRASTSLHLNRRNGEDQVLLRTDRALYRPGDAIKLDVFSTKAHGTVYIDLVKDGQTILTRDVDLNAGRAELTVPATPALSGTLEVNAYLFGADSRAVRDHRLIFVQPADELHIEAHADAASYLPGTEAQLHLRVTDAHGKGVEAALGLEVVDEAVFALAEKQPGFAKVFFYLEQELMKPRFEIHSLSPGEIISAPEANSDPHDESARVLFSAAESIQPHTLDTTFGRDLPSGSRDEFTARYRDALLEQAAQIAHQLHNRPEQQRRNDTEALFAKLQDADGAPLHDAWDTPLRLQRSGWRGEPRYFQILSAGPDREFNTSDDLAVSIDTNEGIAYVPGARGTISLRIEHDHGPFNGLAEVNGIVVDASGAVIPGATVNLSSLNTGTTRRASSRADGNFSFSALPAGKYRITVEARGFMASSRTFDVGPRDQATLTSALQAGATTETVEVDAAAPILMTEAIAAPSPAISGRGLAGAFGNAALAMPRMRISAGAALPASTTQTEAHTRSYFPEALYIAPEIITDSHGAATVSIPIADSITTWRMAMFASTRNGALGTASAGLKVFQDFFVDLDLPLTITQGDRITLPVAIYNYSGDRGDVKLRLQPDDWFEMPNGGTEKTVSVAAGQVGSSQFTVQAKHSGTFKLTLAASMGDRKDTVVREIEVVPDGQSRDAVFNGRLDASSQSAATQSIEVPKDALAEGRKLFVRLYPGALSQVIEGMDGVLRMPYGCFEQTSSSTYPNILALDYMKRSKKLTPEVHAKAEGFIATGYQRLLTFEVPGGGFSWFGQAPANKILTAYGLMEFNDMSAVHDVDSHVIERTRDWLVRQQQPDGSWKPDTNFINEGATNRFNTDVVRITAYIAWSLVNTGYEGPAVDQARSFLRSRLDDSSIKLDAYTLAVLANFAVDSKADPAWTHSIFERLMEAAHKSDGQLWWTAEETSVYATGTSASVETTGLATQALLKSGEQNEATREALAWLLAKKTGAGNWGSTQATIMALRALVMASEKSGGDALGSVDILFNGETFKTVSITRNNNDLLQQFELPNTSGHVELQFHGTGGLAYQIDNRYFVPWDSHPAKSELSIEVDYDRTKLAENDFVAVTTTVHNNLDKKANMVMVDLGIPPGFELQTEDLQSLVEKTAHSQTARLEKFSLTATQAILYFDALGPSETIKIRFRLRAKYPLRTKTFVSRVYEYYDPAVSATASPSQIEVTKR